MIYGRIKKAKFILIIFLIALLLRVLTVFLTHYWLSPDLAYKIIPPDAREYEVARGITKAWEEGRVYDDVPLGVFPRFDFYKAAVFTVTGYNYIVVPLLNAFLGALAVFFIYGIARRLFDEKTAYLSICLYTFFPSLIFWSSQNLKDMLTIFVIITTIWASVKLREPFKFVHLVILALLVPLLVGLNQLRCYIFLFLMYALLLYFLIGITKKNYKKNVFYALFFFVLMSLLPSYTSAGILSELPLSCYRFFKYKVFASDTRRLKKEPVIFSKSTLDISKSLTKATYRHNRWGAKGRAAIRPGYDFSSTAKIIGYLPIGITYFLFAPFPWDAEGLLQTATIPENIVWYAIFIFALYGLYVYRTRWKTFFGILFFLAIAVAAYSLYEGNFGTGYRHKAVLLPFFFIFASAGILHFVERIKNRKP